MNLAERKNRQIVANWLLICAVVIFGMVLLGGLTRLTHSGLSMVEWKPVTGWLPPIGEQAWVTEFEKYKQYPEFQKLNSDMELEGFKSIFWFEYLHRLLGRSIGLLFALPLMFFLVRGMLPRGYGGHLFAMLFLGGAQGALGWFMVASGLVDHPDVSHYRLTAHLGLAVLIYGYILWTALQLKSLGRPTFGARGGLLSALVMLMVFLQLLSGGLVAGLDAGFNWNTWPLMEEQWIPDGLMDHQPIWLNFFENELTVQFQHRIGAYVTTLMVIVLWWRTRQGPAAGSAALLLVALFAQMGLGIATLLSHVPVALGSLHQAGALALLSAAIFHAHRLRNA